MSKLKNDYCHIPPLLRPILRKSTTFLNTHKLRVQTHHQRPTYQEDLDKGSGPAAKQPGLQGSQARVLKAAWKNHQDSTRSQVTRAPAERMGLCPHEHVPHHHSPEQRRRRDSVADWASMEGYIYRSLCHLVVRMGVGLLHNHDDWQKEYFTTSSFCFRLKHRPSASVKARNL
jgi:hypothetical protein